MIKTIALLLLSLTWSSLSVAGRAITTIPFRFEGRVDFTRNYVGTLNNPSDPNGPQDPPTAYGGPKVCARVTLSIQLTNLSSIPQSGSIAYRAGSTGIRAYGMATFDTGVRYMPTTLFLCGTPAGTYTNNAEFTGSNHANLPAAAKWSLAPNETSILRAEAVMFGTYGATYASGGVNVIDEVFQPAFTISVDQDKGAILGSINGRLWALTTSGTAPMCSGKVYSACWDGYYSSVSPTLPIDINGGRPF